MSKRSSIVIAASVLKGELPSKPIAVYKPVKLDLVGFYRQLDLMDRRIDLTLKQLAK